MVLFVVWFYCLQRSFHKKGAIMIRRKDSKGRVLNDGETQRADGRYVYQYTDMLGKRKSIYSWKLLPSDWTPSGKRADLSLREKEKQIFSDLNSGIIPCGGNMTVLQLVEKYISKKQEFGIIRRQITILLSTSLKRKILEQNVLTRLNCRTLKRGWLNCRKTAEGTALYILSVELFARRFKWQLMMICLWKIRLNSSLLRLSWTTAWRGRQSQESRSGNF